MFQFQFHQLAYNWTWEYKPSIIYKEQTAADWLADYKKLTSKNIDTVECFWNVYDRLPGLHQLEFGNIYSIFRNEIKPVWEHSENENGFSLILYLNKANTHEYTMEIYLKSLMVLIGNAYPFSVILNGCTFERKAGGNKIVFWFKELISKEKSLNIRDQLLKAVEIEPDDFTFWDTLGSSGRIDWKLPLFQNYKMAISVKAHRKDKEKILF